MRSSRPAPPQVRVRRVRRVGRLQAGPGETQPRAQGQPLQDAVALNLSAAGAGLRAPPSAEGALSGSEQAKLNSSPNVLYVRNYTWKQGT